MTPSTCVVALALAVTAAWPQSAHAQLTPPDVPTNIQVDPANRLYLVGHAIGTQNYICLPSGAGFAWVLFGPQATLFNDNDRQVITHFLSANPDESGILRPTWQHSGDTSAVWGVATRTSSDSNFVAPGAIPWLRLDVVGAADGTDGRPRLAETTTFIQRINTAGGAAPATGCAQATNVGTKAFVPYSADYYFYRDRRTND